MTQLLIFQSDTKQKLPLSVLIAKSEYKTDKWRFFIFSLTCTIQIWSQSLSRTWKAIKIVIRCPEEKLKCSRRLNISIIRIKTKSKIKL